MKTKIIMRIGTPEGSLLCEHIVCKDFDDLPVMPVGNVIEDGMIYRSEVIIENELKQIICAELQLLSSAKKMIEHAYKNFTEHKKYNDY